jgi:hypothetical protein
MQQLTKEWQPYSGSYQKEAQDIMLENGDVVHCCWPNAGFWNAMRKEGNGKYYGQNIPHAKAKQVRLTHDKSWNEDVIN